MENIVKIEGLTKDYKQIRALDNFDLTVPKGVI